MLELVPIGLRDANAYIAQYHRHHKKAHAMKFAVAVATAGVMVGVAIVARPSARMIDHTTTLEVVRLCTDGTKNACSFLYAACWRVTRALGYKRLITYTLPEEGGCSLRAAGWRLLGESPGGSWSRPSRLREDTHPLGKKLRWEVT